MKLLIDIKINPANPLPAERAAANMSNFTSLIREQMASGELEAAYNIVPQHGFMIANVPTVDAAWQLLMRYQIYPHWLIEMTPLVDPVVLAESGFAAGQARRNA